MKAMDLADFKKKIKELGYFVETSTKHHMIVDKDGKRITIFAVSHKKGGKPYVKAPYVKRCLQEIDKHVK